MALSVAELSARLTADTSGFVRGMDDARKRADKFSDGLKDFGKKATAFVTVPLIGAGVAAFKMGSDLAESLNAAEVAFKSNSGEVKRWAKGLDSAFGFTQKGALDAAAGFRLVTQQSDLTADQILRLAERAADLGSVFNVNTVEAANALKSALVGEMEPARRLGVVLNQGTIEARALAMGFQLVDGQLTTAAKQAAIYAEIMEQTSFAQGDATKTADTAAGQMRVLRADLGRTAEEIGTKLIPVAMRFLGFLKDLLDRFNELSPQQQTMILQIGALAAVMGPLAIGIASVAQAFLFLAANPIVLVIAGIAALGLAIVAAKAGFITLPDPVREAFNVILFVVRTFVDTWLRQGDIILDIAERAFGWIPGLGPKIKNASSAFEQFRADVAAALGPIAEEARGIESALDRLREKGAAIGVTRTGGPGNLPPGARLRMHSGGVVPGPRGADVPIMAQAGERVVPAGGGAGTVTINLTVNGVIDGEDGARKIQDALLDLQRRSGNLGFN